MTFLRWAGSKKQIGETLSHCWEAAQAAGGSGHYIEAFCGSASLFFRLRPKTARLVDINAELTACFKAVKSKPSEVAALLSAYPEDENFYYQLRALNQADLHATEAAARFIYLNRYCFNGLYRTNSKGFFNVPFGGRRVGSLPSEDVLRHAATALRQCSIVQGDFEEAISGKVKPGDFVYLDPPYAKRNHSLSLQYGPDVFGVDDLKRVTKLLNEVHAAGAYFVFSYADCDEVASFARDWNSCVVEVQRSIAADTTRRGRAREILVSNL